MKSSSKKIDTSKVASRRVFLRRSTALVSASLPLLAMGTSSTALANKNKNIENLETLENIDAGEDRCIIQRALAMEQRAIDAYAFAAESDNLDMQTLDTILALKVNHEVHSEVLQTALSRLCSSSNVGTEVSLETVTKPSDDSQRAILEMVAQIELAAANMYLNALPKIKCERLNKIVARLAAGNSMHWTLLRVSMGHTNPAQAMFFGA